MIDIKENLLKKYGQDVNKLPEATYARYAYEDNDCSRMKQAIVNANNFGKLDNLDIKEDLAEFDNEGSALHTLADYTCYLEDVLDLALKALSCADVKVTALFKDIGALKMRAVQEKENVLKIENDPKNIAADPKKLMNVTDAAKDTPIKHTWLSVHEVKPKEEKPCEPKFKYALGKEMKQAMVTLAIYKLADVMKSSNDNLTLIRAIKLMNDMLRMNEELEHDKERNAG